MKKIIILIQSLLLFGCIHVSEKIQAQESAGTPVIKLQYYNVNNQMQYLILHSQMKKNKIFSPQVNKTYDLFLDSASSDTKIASVKTNEEGKAKAFIPVSLKTNWYVLPKHTFIVKDGDEEMISDYTITKTKITLDTASEDDAKNITVTLLKSSGEEWIPASEVEMKIGIQRSAGILSAGSDETYTTDSTGRVVVTLNKQKLPGDEKGNYILTAKVDDNDEVGNIQIQKTVPWGLVTKTDKSFFNLRTLWTTRFRTPYWLIFMAYSILLGVWGTIFYLVYQLIKIKRLGGTNS